MILSIRRSTTYFLWSSNIRFHLSLSVSSSSISLLLSALGSSRVSSSSSRDILFSKRTISRYSRLSCAERTVDVVSDRGLLSNNDKGAAGLSVERMEFEDKEVAGLSAERIKFDDNGGAGLSAERIKLDDNVDCAYAVDQAETQSTEDRGEGAGRLIV